MQIKSIRELRLNKDNVLCSSINPDSCLVKNATVNNCSSVEKNLSKGVNKVCANGFSTSTNPKFWNKLSAYDQQQYQVPAELYVHRAEFEPLLVEGVGWAGQPIVRRIHPILPEVYGDPSDIFTAVEKLPGRSKVHEEPSHFSQANSVNKTIPENAQLQAVDMEVKEESQKNPPYVNKNEIKEETEVKSPSRSSDAISFMDENIKNGPSNRLRSKEADSIPTVKGIKQKTDGQVITKVGVISKKDKRFKKSKNINLNSGFLLTKQKKKSKKKTKVCDSKAKVPLTMKTKIKKSKNNDLSVLGMNKKRSLQPNILLNQQASAPPARRTVIVLANRQLQTYSQANQAKVSINVKERTSGKITTLSKKQNKSRKLESTGKYPEDCKCPEIIDTKTRFPTKICGEAAGAKDKKKKKDWKGKMCPIEHKTQHRRRTFVCNSATFGKAKRKRQLPKCVKPEKKIAPRVQICPPQLEDELEKGKKKKCIKQVEEVKIRLRTKVCKPVIMYHKEEATKVVVQKAVCIEKKVKQTISRHTKVCPPSEENVKQKMSNRQ